MSVEDLQNWVKRQNETPKKPHPVMELLNAIQECCTVVSGSCPEDLPSDSL